MLIVSEQVLQILNGFQLDNCDIEVYAEEPAELLASSDR